MKKIAEKMNYVHGTRHVQTKKQWKKWKDEPLASGEEPTYPKLNLLARAKNYIISYIRFKRLTKKI